MPLLDPCHPTWKNVRYIIYQREIGTHEHFQGYLELSEQLTYEQLHAFEGLEGAHFEKRRGTAKQASHYCSKPVTSCDCSMCTEEAREPTKLEGPWVWGEMSHQGARNELLEIQRELDRGTSHKRIAKEHFPEWIRYQKSFVEYRRVTTEPRVKKTKTFLFVGPAGHGKSTLMKILARYIGSYWKAPHKKNSGLYFDGYDGQEVMIIDEFDGGTMPPTLFNEIADEHECTLPVHGAAGHQMVAKYLFIGTNYAPKFWWKKRSAHQLLQTTRRIDVVFKVGFTKGATIDRNPSSWVHPEPGQFYFQLN